MRKPSDVDEYISSFPKETQKLLKQVRAAIKEVAPQAEEVISYSMPSQYFGRHREIGEGIQCQQHNSYNGKNGCNQHASKQDTGSDQHTHNNIAI